MASKKQTAANRRNAQKSTGPITTAGKASSRFNALKLGIDAKQQIIFDESAEDFTRLAAEYREQYSPANPTERFLVDTLVSNEWRLRRMRMIETDLWTHEGDILLARRVKKNLYNENNVDSSVSSEETFLVAAKSFLHLQSIVNSCERNFHKALKELQRLQAAPPQAEEAPISAPQPEQSTPTSAFSQNEPNFPEATPPAAAPAPPDDPANPAESRPSASDDDPNLPKAA